MKGLNRKHKGSFFVMLLIISIVVSNTCLAVTAESISETITADSQVISSSLAKMMDADPDGTFEVMIELEGIDTAAAVDAATSAIPDYDERIEYLTNNIIRTEAESEEWNYYTRVKRSAMKSCYQAYTNSFTQLHLLEGELIYASTYLPVIIAQLSCSRIEIMSDVDAVISIDFYCDEVEEPEPSSVASPLADENVYYSIQSNIEYVKADVLSEMLNTNGAGVNIGILDSGNPHYTHTSFEDVDITVHYLTNANTTAHASKVLKIISSIAPEANYFCTTFEVMNTIEFRPTLLSEMDWFLDNNVDVVNMSLVVTFNNTNADFDGFNMYEAVAAYLDKLIYLYDITIVKSSGNFGAEGVTSGGMAYNVITVGNYNRSCASIASNSSYFSGYGNAYKPDICAPGSFDFEGTADGSGTSFAAPLVTGVVALIMAYNSSFKTNPAQVKAVLTAAVSLDEHHYIPTQSNYRMYGAGILDAQRVGDIVINRDFASTEMSPDAEDISPTITFQANQVTRISLAFLKCITESSKYSLADLDLNIIDPNGVVVCSSDTLYNNIEIVEFVTTITGRYTIQIRQYSVAEIDDTEVYINTPFSISWIQTAQ